MYMERINDFFVWPLSYYFLLSFNHFFASLTRLKWIHLDINCSTFIMVELLLLILFCLLLLLLLLLFLKYRNVVTSSDALYVV